MNTVMNATQLLTTADVMKAAAVGRETLRFYEERGLIKPTTRTAAGYRKYTPAILEVIAFIKETQQAGFSLQEIQELLTLRATAANTCDNVGTLLNNKRQLIDQEISAWQRKRTIIDTMIANCCAVNDCKP